MNYYMTKEEILAILNKVGKVDLSIPESKKQAVIANPLLQDYLKMIADCAEQYRGTPIPVLPYSSFKLFHETGDREKAQSDPVTGYFPRRSRLHSFSKLAWLYGREEDISEMEDALWAVCDEYTWSLPAHLKRGEGENAFVDKLENGDYMVDLFAAETADALAEISFHMGDKLAPIIRKRIAHLLEERTFSQVLQNTFGWMSNKGNWATVCAGSVGMAAIYAIEDNAHLAEVLARILPACDTFLQGFSKDGACLEGIGYWGYGFSFFTHLADTLLQRTKGEIDLFDDPRVPKVAAFQQKCFFKGGRTVSFSDGSSHGKYVRNGLNCYLYRKYADTIQPPTAELYAYDGHSWSGSFRTLLWVEDVPDVGDAYGCYPLEDAQWYLCSAANGVGIAAKGGHNAEPHNHNDVGSFQIFMNGEEFFSDLGSGEYTRQYFAADTRYDHLVNGSHGHSVPLVDGCVQKAGEEYAACNVTVDETGIAMDIAPAYGLEFLPSLQRVVKFDRAAGTTTLTDTFELVGEHEIRERFMVFGEITAEPGCIAVKMGEDVMTLSYDPALFTVEVAEEVFSNHEAQPTTVKKLDLVTRAQGTFTAAFIVTP
ncbi:MAG: heparinase II/III family protein [Clostridia bacterium]|nr:heparinase II/III family protein [Clostridia bacterium]